LLAIGVIDNYHFQVMKSQQKHSTLDRHILIAQLYLYLSTSPIDPVAASTS